MLRDRIRSYSTEFFSFKTEETYTLTTFVDQKLSLSVYSKSTYDSLVWLGFFDLSKLLKKISDCRSFSLLKILTGYRPYSRSLYCSIRVTSPKYMYHIYQKLSITTLIGAWFVTRLAKLMLCFYCRFSNLSRSADHSRTNFLKLGRWNKEPWTQEI